MTKTVLLIGLAASVWSAASVRAETTDPVRILVVDTYDKPVEGVEVRVLNAGPTRKEDMPLGVTNADGVVFYTSHCLAEQFVAVPQKSYRRSRQKYCAQAGVKLVIYAAAYVSSKELDLAAAESKKDTQSILEIATELAEIERLSGNTASADNLQRKAFEAAGKILKVSKPTVVLDVSGTKKLYMSDDLSDAIKSVQKRGGLRTDGILGPETIGAIGRIR